MNVVAAYAAVEKTTEAVGKLASLKEKLTAQPHQAAAALAGCLAEVRRTYLAVMSEVTRLMVLSAPGALDLEGKPDLRPLIELEGTAVRARVEQSRGHCSRIRNIYLRDLDKWFARVFVSEQANYRITEEIFETLTDTDVQTLAIMQMIGGVIGRRAGEILTHMMRTPPDPAAASVVARAAYVELKPMRAALQALDLQLSGLENEFIETSGAV